MNEKISQKKNFLKGFIVENPLFVSILGTCPALATTTSLEAAVGMGILFTIVLICSNVLISLLRKLIPDEIRTPSYIVVIAAFVTMVRMLAQAYLPELYTTLGVFISLIVVNCIVLGRAESFASKNNVLSSLVDALGMGLGYTLALIIIALFREVLGTGMITFGQIFTFIPKFSLPILAGNNFDYSIQLFQQPAGAFIVFGVILAFIAYINNSKKDKELALKRIAIQKAKEEAALKMKGETK